MAKRKKGPSRAAAVAQMRVGQLKNVYDCLDQLRALAADLHHLGLVLPANVVDQSVSVISANLEELLR